LRFCRMRVRGSVWLKRDGVIGVMGVLPRTILFLGMPTVPDCSLSAYLQLPRAMSASISISIFVLVFWCGTFPVRRS